MALRTSARTNKNTRVVDLGIGRILQELNIADNSFTKVGFPADGEIKPGTKKGSEHDQATEMSEIAQIAAIHEWGEPKVNVPERSFFRTSFDENLQQTNNMKVKLYNKIIDGKMTAKRALGLIGEFNVSKMKLKIREIDSPPLKPATIRRKGLDVEGTGNPLIDTAQMINSVQHVEEMNSGVSKV